MKNYKELAFKYLMINKKRTVLTILGVALSTMILFVFLNSVLSFLVTQRNICREEIKYETIFWCESRAVAEQIAKEKYIKDFEIKGVYKPTEEVFYENALCANFVHPYQMNIYLKRATQEYGVSYDYTELATFYFATGEDNVLVIIVLFVLMIAYIFAIFSVAVVRNSIQLISLEQIKDYGVLRCIGATKGQLKKLVHLMSFILELSGIALGVGLGFGVYLFIAYKAKLEIGFHIIGIPFIMVAFFGDLYFVVQENCRFVNKLTPVAAVRGEFKLNQKQLKPHGKGVAGRLLGIEGEYASKSLKRNPARMWKSVGAMAMGIAMVVVTVSVCGTIVDFVTQDNKRYGRYQVVNSMVMQPGVEQLHYEKYLLSEEDQEGLQKSKQVSSVKNVYDVSIYTADPWIMAERETDKLKKETDYGQGRAKSLESYRNGLLNEEAKRIYEFNFASNTLSGYDAEDYKRLEPYLVEGTLDLSDKGIVLINGTYVQVDNTEVLNEVWEEYVVTDFRVGDKIEFVDMQALGALVRERMEELKLSDGGDDYNLAAMRELIYACYKELSGKGVTKTFVIEGIVSWDANKFLMSGGASFVLPLERYWEETGLGAQDNSGTMYRLEGHALGEDLKELWYRDTVRYMDCSYLMVLDTIGTVWDFVVGGMIFVLFVVIIHLLNVSNTTASDLHLRRKEFAQLRVLGMSQKRLIYTVMLEGIITAFLADVFGVILGYGIIKAAITFINMGYYVPLSFSWGTCILMLIVNTVIICLTIYLPIKGMKIDMAEQLQAAGE